MARRKHKKVVNRFEQNFKPKETASAIPDPALIIAVIMLVSVSLVIIYSASSARAFELTGNSSFYLSRQLIRVAIGSLGLLFLTFFNYRSLRFFGFLLMALAVGALIYLLIPGAVEPIKGARRAFYIAGQSVQPAEIAKFALIICLAHSVTHRGEDLRSWPGYLRRLFIIGGIGVLIYLQPDFSTALMIVLIGLFILYLGGTKLGYLFLTAVVMGLGAYKLLFVEHYRAERIDSYVQGLTHPELLSHQVNQSLIGLGDGGLLGVGIGMSHQKLFFLPEPFTDFVFSILGEELGFLGTAGTVILFLLIGWRGMKIARRAPDAFGYVLAGTITFAIITYGMVNLMVVTGLLPVTGLPLPFLTYGGSSLIFTMFMVGILLNISRQGIDPEEIPEPQENKSKPRQKKKKRAQKR